MIRIIITSFKRPLQTDLILKTAKKFTESNISCVINMNDPNFIKSNENLITEHNDINFVIETTYKQNLLDIIKNCQEEYILLYDDDSVLIGNHKELYPLIDIMKEDNSIVAVSTRLGLNITDSYGGPPGWILQQPNFLNSDTYLKWNWTESNPIGDWGYPHPICYNIYKKEYIYNLFEKGNFNCPRDVEVFMDNNRDFSKPYMISPLKSLSFTTPINKASWSACKCSSNQDYTLENLNKLYLEGYRIDTSIFDNFVPYMCHQELDIKFERIK